jgi:rod shape-determining protein MreD
MIKNRAVWRKMTVYGLYIILLSVLQVTWPDSAVIFGSRPDLILILVVLSGYLFGMVDGFIVGLASGFMRDMFAGQTLGLGMLLFMYIGLAASVLLRRFLRRNILLGVIQVVLFTVIYSIVLDLLTFWVPPIVDAPYSLTFLLQFSGQRLPGQCLVNALSSIPVIFLLAWAGPYKRGQRLHESEDHVMGATLWRVE